MHSDKDRDIHLVFTSQREIIKTLKVTNIDFFTQKSSLLTYPIGKTIFSNDSMSCMDFFILDFFPPDSTSPPDCQPAKPWSPGRQTRSLGLQDSP